MHVKIVQRENRRFTLSFLANWKLYRMTGSTERSPPPHTQTQLVAQEYLRVEGGFHVQYRGNVLLWPKSDESKKSMVLFYLFTLWSLPLTEKTPLISEYIFLPLEPPTEKTPLISEYILLPSGSPSLPQRKLP
jgi:hypothetical protein